MVAFNLFWIDIYRYGIFYLVTFIVAYAFLRYVGKSSIVHAYPGVKRLLTEKLDDLFLAAILGVMIGGRLGHVFLYDWRYFKDHLLEIFNYRSGGMSFIGGVIGVTVALLYLKRRLRLQTKDIFVLGDLILCVVPLGIMLGRYGNYLNQELRGRPITEFPLWIQALLQSTGLAHVYTAVDTQLRANTNLFQSFAEGGLMLVIIRIVFLSTYRKHPKPWLIVGIFMIGYAIVRFLAEYLKELPAHEFLGPFSTSQWIMILFAIAGIVFVKQSSN